MRNKHLILLFLSLFLPVSSNSQGAYKPFGLGIILGNPSGFTGKYWLNPTVSIDGIVGAGFGRNNHLVLSGDIVKHWDQFTPVSKGHFLLGCGAGPLIGMGNDFDFGVRVKGLADYLFLEPSIDLFFEIAPAVMLFDAEFEITGGIGIRWYFIQK